MADENTIAITHKETIQNYLNPGALAYIFFKSGKHYKVTKQRLLDLNNNGFLIPHPFPNDSEVSVKPGVRFLYKIFTPNGHLEFESPCLKLVTLKHKAYIRVALPKSIARIQRRETFRVTLSCAGRFLMGSDFDKVDITGEGIQVTLLDVSLGGALLASNIKMDVGMKGTLIFRFPTLPEPLYLSGRIQRANSLKSLKGKYKYRYGFRIDRIDANSEYKLSRLLNELQLATRSVRTPGG